MASEVVSDEKIPIAQPAQRPPGEPGPRPYRHRFSLLYAVLAAATAAAVLGTVLAVTHTSVGGSGPAWSAWKPSGGGLGAAKQIADHVSGTYHLPSGQQLVDVIATAPSVSPSNQQIPIHYIAVRGPKGKVDSIFPIDSSNSLMYSLCGLGASCSISSGTPSVARGTLVRREILELALYTFKYVGGIKNVIAFMPPTPGAQATLAIYLQKSDFTEQLKQPLPQTLNTKVPLPSAITAKEQETIDSTTQSRVYKFTLSQAQQGDAILVLQPLA
jgi:hypothetical protein